MKRFIFIYLLSLFAFSNAISQVPADAIQAVRNISNFGQFGHYTELVAGSTVVGTPYLEELWKPADIVLASGQTLSNYLVRYNLAGDFLEIKTLDGVKAIERKNITRFILKDALQIRYFVMEIAEDTGLFEILAEGQLQLLCKYEVTVKPPDYVPQFNVGSRDTRILPKETLFYKQHAQVSKLPGRANTFFKLFGAQADAVQAYADKNDLLFREHAGATMIFKYYNELTSH